MTENSPTGAAPIPLFLHIPKCGGTTLTNCIYESTYDRSYPHSDDRFFAQGVYYYPAGLHKDQDLAVSQRAQAALGRSDLRAVVGHFSYGIHRYLARPGAYLTLLRHPLERVTSLYYHIHRYESCELHQVIRSGNMSIEEFIQTLACREIDNDQVRRIAGREPDFGKCTRDDLELAKSHLADSFAVAGVTDMFDECMILIKRAFGWKTVPPYLPDLVNKQRPPRDLLPRRTIDAILEYNRLDLELYQYVRKSFRTLVARQGRSFEKELADYRDANRRRGEDPRTVALHSEAKPR